MCSSPVDRVEQHLGLQAARVVARVILSVDDVVRVRRRTELIGAGPRDRADQFLEIESALDEVLFEGGQQLRIGRRVRVADVVFRSIRPRWKKCFQ